MNVKSSVWVCGINAALSSLTALYCPLLTGSSHFIQNRKQMWSLSLQAERRGSPREWDGTLQSPGWAQPDFGRLHVSEGTGTGIWRTSARLFWVSLCSPCGAEVSSEKVVCWSASCFYSLASENKVNRCKWCYNKFYTLLGSPAVWKLTVKELFSVPRRRLKEKSSLMIFNDEMIQ